MEWLPDGKYTKLKGILRLQLNEVMKPFRMYGQDIYIAGAIDEIIELAEDFSMNCRGKDKPISIAYVRRKKKK